MSDEKHKIVILDDKFEVLNNLREMLEKNICDCNIFCFDKTDDSFWNLINEVEVDLFIIDIRLGDVDGRNITEKIIKKKRGSLFLFISGYDYTIDSLTRFKGKCVYDFMAKPIVRDIFVNRVIILLNLARSFRPLAKACLCGNYEYKSDDENIDSVRAHYRELLEQDKVMIQSFKKDMDKEFAFISKGFKI